MLCAMDIFSRRNRQSQAADVYKYDELPRPLRVQILGIWRDIFEQFPAALLGGTEVFYAAIQRAVCQEQGVFTLTRNPSNQSGDLFGYFLEEKDVSKCFDVIEIAFDFMSQHINADTYTNSGVFSYVQDGVAELNERFKQHCIGYEFRDGMIIRIDSGFIHSEAVGPAMTLLHEPYLVGANQEFLRAHEHFRHGRFAESINECLKAFESTMKAICDKRGWSYRQNDTASALLTTCANNNLFPSFMQSSLGGLRSVLENVATIRNRLSAHGQGVQPVNITEPVAAFVIHSTAANILLLASLEKG